MKTTRNLNYDLNKVLSSLENGEGQKSLKQVVPVQQDILTDFRFYGAAWALASAQIGGGNPTTEQVEAVMNNTATNTYDKCINAMVAATGYPREAIVAQIDQTILEQFSQYDLIDNKTETTSGIAFGVNNINHSPISIVAGYGNELGRKGFPQASIASMLLGLGLKLLEGNGTLAVGYHDTESVNQYTSEHDKAISRAIQQARGRIGYIPASVDDNYETEFGITKGSGNLNIGTNTIVDANCSGIIGNRNVLGADCHTNFMAGNQNTLGRRPGSNALVANNIIAGGQHKIVTNENKSFVANAIVGSDCVVIDQDVQNSLIAGSDHIINTNLYGGLIAGLDQRVNYPVYGKVLLGRDALDKPNLLFGLGNVAPGDQSGAHNALEVYLDGTVKGDKSTSDSDDGKTLTTKDFVDTGINNIVGSGKALYNYDTTKGTVESRLTSLGFNEVSLDGDDIGMTKGTATINSLKIKKEGRFAQLDFDYGVEPSAQVLTYIFQIAASKSWIKTITIYEPQLLPNGVWYTKIPCRGFRVQQGGQSLVTISIDTFIYSRNGNISITFTIPIMTEAASFYGQRICSKYLSEEICGGRFDWSTNITQPISIIQFKPNSYVNVYPSYLYKTISTYSTPVGFNIEFTTESHQSVEFIYDTSKISISGSRNPYTITLLNAPTAREVIEVEVNGYR